MKAFLAIFFVLNLMACDQDLSRDHFVTRVFRVAEWPFDLSQIMPEVFCKSLVEIKTGFPTTAEDLRIALIESYEIQQVEFLRRRLVLNPTDTFFRGEVVSAYVVWINPVYCPRSRFEL